MTEERESMCYPLRKTPSVGLGEGVFPFIHDLSLLLFLPASFFAEQ